VTIEELRQMLSREHEKLCALYDDCSAATQRRAGPCAQGRRVAEAAPHVLAAAYELKSALALVGGDP
jgi:hypothetical protein